MSVDVSLNHEEATNARIRELHDPALEERIANLRSSRGRTREEILAKKTRREKCQHYFQEQGLNEQIAQFMIEFDLKRSRGGEKFNVAVEFKKQLGVPNPHVDGLRKEMNAKQEELAENEKQIKRLTRDIAEVCEIKVGEVNGKYDVRGMINKGPPRVSADMNRIVRQEDLPKGWKVLFTPDDGKPYYVHVFKQTAQWTPPSEEQADPATPPPTPDPLSIPIDRGWTVKFKKHLEWEPLTESKAWHRLKEATTEGQIWSRAGILEKWYGVLRTEEVQKKGSIPPPETASESEPDEDEDLVEDDEDKPPKEKKYKEMPPWVGKMPKELFEPDILHMLPRQFGARQKNTKLQFVLPEGLKWGMGEPDVPEPEEPEEEQKEAAVPEDDDESDGSDFD